MFDYIMSHLRMHYIELTLFLVICDTTCDNSELWCFFVVDYNIFEAFKPQKVALQQAFSPVTEVGFSSLGF